MESTSIINDAWSSSAFDEYSELSGFTGPKIFRARFEPPVDQKNVMLGNVGLPPGTRLFHHCGARVPGEMFLTTGGIFILNEDLALRMADAGLTGWSAIPVPTYSKKREYLGDFRVLQVHGRCGQIEGEKSVWEALPLDATGVPDWRVTGIYIDPASIPDTDFFTGPYGGSVFASSRVKEIFRRIGVRGAEFTSLREISYITTRYRGPGWDTKDRDSLE